MNRVSGAGSRLRRASRSVSGRTALFTSLGAIVLLASWLVEPSSWLSSALVNVGSSILIFAPLLVAGAGIERRLGGVESSQQYLAERQVDTTERIEKIGQRVSDIAAAGEQLRQEVWERITSSRDLDYKLFEEIADTPTSEGVADALDRAEALGLIPSRGCRAELRETEVYLSGENRIVSTGNYE